IRTWQMHQVAEYGVAAHWRYKEGQDQKPIQMPALQQQLRDLTDFRNNLEFLTSVLRDMTADQVFVFTPRGDLIDLPEGSTPIDFAYRIHTEVGNHCAGARVNGRIVPLDYKLRTGDVVEIQTRPNAQPSYDWLSIVRTSSARSKIRAYFREARRAEFILHGRTVLERELNRLRIASAQLRDALPEILKALNFRTEDDLYASIGEGLTSVQAVTQRLRAMLPALPSHDAPSAPHAGREIRAMQIEDADGYLTRRASCCHPLPGDELRGYISRGRGIVVHRASCTNLRALEEQEPERIMHIDWLPRADRAYPVTLRFETLDRPGVLADITTIVGSSNINIADVRVRRNPKVSTAVIDIAIQVSSAQELRALTQKLSSLEDVLAVSRLQEGKGNDASSASTSAVGRSRGRRSNRRAH
ncbi:MAG: TGS domain-containing protein, partial [Fimbriimonadales bacterium]|nr:TGS domain-containing protein [Fimbriimonadales bacterium]